jgi:CHAD domain-containing protein
MTRFQDYYTELIKTFNDCHQNLLNKTTEEDIHKLRTTLKKLKTFNILLDGLLFRQKDFPIELTNLFKLSGEVRDIQIQKNILDEYEDGYKAYLLFILEYKVSRFKIKESFDIDIQRLTDKLNMVEDYHIDDQIIKNIQTRIKMSYDETLEMIKKVSPENLHDIRKNIKRIYYTRLMLGDPTDIEKLDKIQDVIGMWHDCEVTIEEIKKFDNNLDIIGLLEKKRDSLYNESLELIKFF